jgi:hypothetical protein
VKFCTGDGDFQNNVLDVEMYRVGWKYFKVNFFQSLDSCHMGAIFERMYEIECDEENVCNLQCTVVIFFTEFYSCHIDRIYKYECLLRYIGV